MGFVGNAVKKVFSTVGLASDTPSTPVDDGVGASVAPVEANTADEEKTNNNLKKRKKGKASLIVKPNSNTTGGGTGLNL